MTPEQEQLLKNLYSELKALALKIDWILTDVEAVKEKVEKLEEKSL
jgi:hypothetical protein